MAKVLDRTVGGYVGRLAPSPTGALHLGNVRTFMIAYLRARSLGGKLIMRIEDLDHPRDKPGAAKAAIEDLKWLGFEWDEEYVQSERLPLYRAALERLGERVYPCVCSRSDVENAQSAPHAGEQLYYSGICRGRFADWAAASAVKKNPVWRFRVDEGNSSVAFKDVFAGRYEQDVAKEMGDFAISRDEFGAGYTLAVVVDDAAMGVTEVVRGDDLLPATPSQILLQRALGLPTPNYLHVPLIVGADGRRLAKRHGDMRIATYREKGVKPECIIGFLAASCGWAGCEELVSLAELLPRFDLSTIPHRPLIAAPISDYIPQRDAGHRPRRDNWRH